ncbi:hypothetical protein VC83_07305 [Pseudogymnoascus destructans]|uniref:Uncharacterized protein n=1 Tax=Pseudogymnoascus destructans TaxID=655981 RepID=A0A177A3B5_9PEZI|nr:uncharacterized protein VC83_07305 [Pseudogymnoascus destructans]OAF56597.1 hypothetical protein VC83_07305 [Pseudogymnoascus destructans]
MAPGSPRNTQYRPVNYCRILIRPSFWLPEAPTKISVPYRPFEELWANGVVAFTKKTIPIQSNMNGLI